MSMYPAQARSIDISVYAHRCGKHAGPCLSRKDFLFFNAILLDVYTKRLYNNGYGKTCMCEVVFYEKTQHYVNIRPDQEKVDP